MIDRPRLEHSGREIYWTDTPSSPTETVPPVQISDELAELPVTSSAQVYTGSVWNIHAETVDLGDAGEVRREFMAHTGAVAVLVLNDQGEILLLKQYRHPVRSYLWELPAGLLDVPGEPWLEAAQRELAEEADLWATQWHTLADFYTSPGGSDEFIRIYLAQDIGRVDAHDRHERVAEEANMVPVWVPLEDAVNLVLAGRIHNPATVVGILAAHTARERGWSSLRPADAAFDLKSTR